MKNDLLGTYTLFFHSFYYMLLTAALVFLMFFIANRSRKHYRTRTIVSGCSFVIIYILFRLFEEMAYSLTQVKVFSFISALCIIGFLMTQLIYYSKKNYLILNLSVFFILLTRFHFYHVNDYTHVSMTEEYRALMLYFIVIIGIFVIRDTYHILTDNRYVDNEENALTGVNGKYKISETLLINGGMFIALVCFSCSVYDCRHQFITDFGITTYFSAVAIAFFFYMPNVKIPFGYRQIISNMMDTVLVLDQNNMLLYTNATSGMKYFQFGQKVEFNDMSTYIKGAFLSEKYLKDGQKQMIFESEDEELKVMNVSRKVLLRKNKIVGYMINISDFSHLDSMIREKEKQKNDLDHLRHELTKYGQISKHLVAEKQRNRLLVEVQNQLGHHMAELANHIITIIHLVNDETITPEEKQPKVQTAIELGIQIAKGNLSRIRETVAKYKSSYSEKGSEIND